VSELKELRESVAKQIEERNRQLEEGVFVATSDPRRPERPPKGDPPAPVLNFASLDNAAQSLTRAAARYEKAFAGCLAGASESEAKTWARANDLIRQSDQMLLAAGGLPKRPWYQHLLYAPGFYTGYGVKTMPGAREAIEQKQW